MPRSTRSTALTRDHTAAQAALAADVQRQVLQVWGAVDPRNIDAAWPAVSRALASAIRTGHATSTATAAEYLREHAQAEGVSLADIVTAPTLDADRLATALRVTGPVALKRAAGLGRTPVTAAQVAAVQLAGSAARLVQAGGRDTITGTVDASSQIVGYRRYSGSARSCYFCAMLISRGAVYKSEQSGGVASGRRGNQPQGHKYHDHCSCGVEALYGHEDEPAGVEALFNKYSDVTAGLSGEHAIRAWREAYDGHIAPLPAKSAILGRDLAGLTDDAVSELLGSASTDDEVEYVVAELDRRDDAIRAAQKVAADKAKRAAAREAKRQAKAEVLDVEYERRLDAGQDPESAYADTYGVDVERQRRDQAITTLRSNGYAGRNFDDLSRAAFRHYVEQSYLDAETVCRGHLLNGTRGLNDTRDARKLFDGNEAYARANASEELLGYWQQNGGRMTLDDYRASLIGGAMKMKGQAAWL